MYKPKPWATFSGAYNDLERHNNTNNNQATVALRTPSGGVPYDGPLDHVDHSRVASLGAVLAPNEHYGLDFNYAYSDVYAATNICYLNGATATLPGAATTPGSVPAAVAAYRERLMAPAYGVCAGRDRLRQLSAGGLLRQGLHGCSYAVRDRWLSVSPRRQNSLQYRLSHQRCERQPVLQRCARRQRLAGLQVSVSLCESCLDGPSRIDLEGGIQLLRLRRGRSFRLAVLQHFNVSASSSCSLHSPRSPTRPA